MVPRLLAFLSAAAWLGVARPARADDWSLHVLGAARVGWTDNLYSTETNQVADGYTELGPGALFTLESPRTVTTISYDLDANLYFQQTNTTVTHHLSYRGSFQVSPLAELQTSLTAAIGSLNTINTAASAATGDPTLTTATSSNFRSLEAGQSYGVQLSRDWRVTQTAGARVVQTDISGGRNTGEGADLGLGADRSWRYTAAGLRGNVALASLGVGNLQTTVALTSSLRRDLGTHWSAGAEAGASGIFGGAGGTLVEPTGALLLGYFPAWGTAGLALRSSTQANLTLGADTTTYGAVLNAGLPVHWLGDDENGAPRLGIDGTAGYSDVTVRNASTGMSASGFRVASGDLALNYGLRAGVHLSVRYQYQHQVAGSTVMTAVPLTSFDRTTVLFMIDGRWPDRTAAEVPVHPSLRVQSDEDDATSTDARQQRP